MKPQYLVSIFTVFAATFVTTLFSGLPVRSQQLTFVCGVSSEGFPATVVKSPQHGDVPIIIWKSNRLSEINYDNETRCNIVSERFQKFSNQGTLKYLTTGMVNRQPVICAVASQNAPCNEDSLLFTLKPGSDANQTLKTLFDVRSGAGKVPGVYETGPRIYQDFDEFMDTALSNTSQESSSVNSEKPETSSESKPLF